MQKAKYIVGGFVRDYFLNKPSNDIDYVVTGYSKESYQNENPTHKLVGKSFPVFLTPEGHEVALARKERSTGTGYNDFVVYTENITLEQDLYRRDLTINSLAFNDKGDLIDYFNGKRDLDNKVLKHTSHHFVEDPVRVLRLARFKCTYPDFTIHESTKLLIKSMKKQLKSLVKERVTKEVYKILELPNSRVFFDTLKDLNILQDIFPEVYIMTKCREDSPYHREISVYEHTMMVIERLDSPVLKLTALFHDIAKPILYLTQGNSYGHEQDNSIEKVINSFFTLDSKTLKIIMLLIHNHINIFKIKEFNDKTLLKFIKQFNKETFILLIEFANADALGRITDVNKELLSQKESEIVIDLIKELKVYSPKEYLESLTVRPSNEIIKQYVHKKELNIVKKFRGKLNG